MRISDWSSDVCSSDLLPRWCRPTRTSAMAIDNVTFGIQEQALQVQRRRLELIAANIANADTPGFQARDLDFRKVLESAQKSGISPGAMTQTSSSATTLYPRTEESRVGNDCVSRCRSPW